MLGVLKSQERLFLLAVFEFPANAFESLAHGARGVGARVDFRGDSPDQRHERGGSKADQRDARVAARVLTYAVGDEKSRAESDCDLRNTHNARDGKVFAEFVQGKL